MPGVFDGGFVFAYLETWRVRERKKKPEHKE